MFTDNQAFLIAMEEIVLLFILSIILGLRGWKLSDLNIRFTKDNFYFGVLIVLINYVICLFMYSMFSSLLGGDTFSNVKFESEMTLISAIIVSIVNPLFEELIVIVYVFKSMEKRHDVFFVISLSAFLRLSYHLYQGPIAAISVLPLGLLFAYIYHRWRSLLPLIVAHGIMDFLGLYGLR